MLKMSQIHMKLGYGHLSFHSLGIFQMNCMVEGLPFADENHDRFERSILSKHQINRLPKATNYR